MAKYIGKRLFYIFISLWLIISITFFMMRAAPGSPLSDEKKLPPKIEAQLAEQYGLNDPWYEQYATYLTNILKWDFGTSMKYQDQSVNEMINQGFPVSLVLGLESIFLAVAIGIILGVIAALRHNKWQDYTAMMIAVLGISVPSFIIASVLQYIFSIQLQWTPVAGWDTFAHTILPAIALSAGPLAFIARLMRSTMLEVMNQDYMKTAKAKGLSGRVIVYKHGLRNALLPVVSFMGPLVAGILTGSFVIEKIFGIPGLGQSFVTSITNRDYTTIMGVTVFYSILLLLSILIVDLIYGMIDPRIKIADRKEN